MSFEQALSGHAKDEFQGNIHMMIGLKFSPLLRNPHKIAYNFDYFGLWYSFMFRVRLIKVSC